MTHQTGPVSTRIPETASLRTVQITSDSLSRPHSRPRRARLIELAHAGCKIAIVCGICLGAYLCLRPSGALQTVSWLPDFVAKWADQHGRLRNLPAFALLTAPILIVSNGRSARLKAVVGVAAFSASLECAQYFIPTRMFEWQDIFWSWIGVVLAWSAFEAMRLLLTRIHSHRRTQRRLLARSDGSLDRTGGNRCANPYRKVAGRI